MSFEMADRTFPDRELATIQQDGSVLVLMRKHDGQATQPLKLRRDSLQIPNSSLRVICRVFSFFLLIYSRVLRNAHVFITSLSRERIDILL